MTAAINNIVSYSTGNSLNASGKQIKINVTRISTYCNGVYTVTQVNRNIFRTEIQHSIVAGATYKDVRTFTTIK